MQKYPVSDLNKSLNATIADAAIPDSIILEDLNMTVYSQKKSQFRRETWSEMRTRTYLCRWHRTIPVLLDFLVTVKAAPHECVFGLVKLRHR